jgi:hypothetical protein
LSPGGSILYLGILSIMGFGIRNASWDPSGVFDIDPMIHPLFQIPLCKIPRQRTLPKLIGFHRTFCQCVPKEILDATQEEAEKRFQTLPQSTRSILYNGNSALSMELNRREWSCFSTSTKTVKGDSNKPGLVD